MAIRTRAGRPLSDQEQKRLDDLFDQHVKRVLPGAEAYLVRSYVIGKLRKTAEDKGMRYEDLIDVLALPFTIKAALESKAILSWEAKSLETMKQLLAIHITDMADSMKREVATTVLRDKMAGEDPRETARRLLHKFGDANKDWRRIAVTESGHASEAGYLSRIGPDKFVIGVALPNACKHCLEKIHGKIFKVSDASAEGKNWNNEVWAGKTNVGRSFSAMKRIGVDPGTGKYILAPRTDAEMAKPTIPLHAHCRCRWQEYDPLAQSVNPTTGLAELARHPDDDDFEEFMLQYGEEGMNRVRRAIDRLNAASADPEIFEAELERIRG